MLQTLIAEEKVVSDPSCLNPKQNPKSVTIVHLAGRHISVLDNFHRYVNLEVLYLNGNVHPCLMQPVLVMLRFFASISGCHCC
jgi:hypothetical protein